MKKNKLIIVGYSGHSYLCIETAINNGTSIVGYCELEKISDNPYNLKFLGKEEDLDVNNQLFIAIGDNTIRRKVYEKLIINKTYLDTSIIHPRSIVSSSALIKKQWGSNLTKFEGLQLPGGVTFNGAKIYDDAIADIDKLEEQIAGLAMPPEDMIG